MDNLADFRRQYPQYNDMSDVELADAIHRKFYSDLPKADVFKKLAVKPTAPIAAPANAVPMDGVAPAVPATAPVPRDTSVAARLAELDKEERAAQKRLDRITSNTEKYLSSTLGKVVGAPAKLFGSKTTAEEALDVAKAEKQETIERINRERAFIAREGRVAPKPTVGQRVTGTLAAIPRGAIEGTSQFLGTLGITGSEGEQSARAMEQRGTRFAENIGLGANEAAEFDPIQRNLESFGGGLGSIIPYVATELLGRKAAPLTKAAPYVARGAQAILGAGQGATQARQQMDEFEQETGQKIDPTTRRLVQAGGGTIGLTELLPISRMVNGLPTPVRTAVTKRITDIVARTGAGKLAPEAARTAIREVVQGIESRAVGRIATQGILPEALQEGGTQFAQNVLERTAYNPNQELMEGVAENAILGGLVGGTVRGVTEVAQKVANRGKKQEIDPAAVNAEFQRLAAEQAGKVMKANPGMKQNDAVKFVEDNAEALFNLATANIVSGTKGVLDVPVTTGAGMDVGGGSGAGTATDRESLATEGSTTVAGADDAGRLDRSVSGVSVPTTGTGTGVGTLIEPTAKQVKAMVPTIEQAFEASALDFEEAYADVLDKNNKLNSQQKTLAARILVQSPEVDPYDAIGSVLDRGLETLLGKPVPKKVPSTSRTTVTGPPNAREIQDEITARLAEVNAKAAEIGTTLNAQFKEQYDADMASIERGEEPKFGFGPSQQVSLNPFEAAPVEAVQETVQDEAAPAGTPVELVPYKDIALSTMWYKGGSQTAVAGNEKPAWVPDDVLEYDIPGRPRPTGDQFDARVEQFTAKDGTVGTKVSVLVPTIDEVYGDRGNTAAATIWLRDADPKDIDSAVQTAEAVARWVADPNNSKAADGPLNQIADKAISFIATQSAPASVTAPTTAGAKPSTARGPSKIKAAGDKGAKGKAVKKVINSKPGKTVAEKIFNMAQAEVDAMPKEDLDEQITPYSPEYESIRATPGINTKRMAKMLGPQLYGDPTNMGQVCIKEVLQNSFDATRTAVDKGQITQGKIEISISRDERTLTVKDNGIGMTPELLGGKFLQIAGTDKEGDKNAGGFGIAKMLFLYANKNIRVVTARDGRIAELNATGEQLFDGLDDPDARPFIDIRDLEPADYAAFPNGHGTIIQLTIPEESGDYKINPLPWQAQSVPSLMLSPLFADIEVSFSDYTGSRAYAVDIGSNFPIQDYTQFVGVKFPWGTAKVYVTRNQTTQKYGQNMHILSNGLWQFSNSVSKDPSNIYSDPVPYRFYVDIVPSVKPDEPGYPFNFNRQSFTDDAKADFNKVKAYIDAVYAYKSRAGEATSFGVIQYFDENGQLTAPIDLTPDIPVVDTAFTRIAEGDIIKIDDDGSLLVNGQRMPELTPEELKAGIPSANDLRINPDLIDTNLVMVHDNADVVIKSTGEKMPIPDFMRRQFGERFDDFMSFNGEAFLKLRDEVARVMGYPGLRDEAIGVSFDPEYRGVSIRLPFSGSFINPLVPKYADGLRAGYGIFGTMIHELAHYKERSHNARFPAEYQDIDLNMEADTGFAYRRFKDNFADTIAADYADIVKLGVELFNGQNSDISIEYRGNKFTDGDAEQTSDGDGDRNAGDVRGPSGEGSTGESLLSPSYEGRDRTGERGDLGAGDGGGTEPLTDANVEEAVSVKLTKAQIKRLEAAAGIRGREVNSLQKRIIQSRNENETKGLIKRLAGAMRNPGASSGIIASLTQSMPVGGYRLILGFQQIEDVFRLAKLAGMKSIGKIDTIMREEYIPYVNRIVRRASDLEQEWTAFASRDPEGNTTLDDTIMYSNMLDADPSMAVTAAEYIRIDPKLKELEASLATETDANKQNSLKRQITIRKEAIKDLYFGGTLKDDKGNPVLDDNKEPVVVQGWNSLPPEGRKIFKAARDFHRANFNEHYRLLMQRIDDAKFDSNDAVKLKASIEQMFNKARERTIYFPVKRFGEYWLSVGKDFYMRETPAELKALQRRLKDQKETRPMVTGTSRADLRNKVASNDASAALKGILDALDGGNTPKSNGKPRLERDDMEGLRDLVFQMYLTALPEADMRRRFVHRRFVTGFSTDSLRTFAATAVASANQLGRLAYNYKFQNVLEEAKAESESDELTPYRDALRLEIEERVKSAVAPESNSILLNAINNAIAFGSKLTFYHHLSSAASAAVNLTQLHTLGLPVLSGEFGEAKTAAMAARYTTSLLAGREIPNPFRDEDGNIGLQAPEFKFQNSAYMRNLKKNDPDRYKQTMAAWEYAQDHDVIESTFASSSQLYERSNTPTGDFNFRQAVRRGEVLTAGQRAAANTMSAMGFLFHSTETIGRSVMYMSSFDLAYERAIGKGKTPEQAGIEARKLATDLTNKAMFDFTNWNKSRFAKAPATRLALQMTSYIHSLSSLMLRSFVGMLPYFNKEGKAAAARVFFGSSGVTALYGGVQATLFSPLIMGAYTVAKYVESLLEDDDEEEDIKEGVLGEKTVERQFLKYADENGNELGKKNMDYYIRATFIPETFGKGTTLQNALGLSDKAAANLATAADSGIPAIFGVDISNSVAMGDLPFIWSNVQVKGDTPEVRAYEATARMALGPFGSVGISYVKAADAWNNGDIQQAMELAVPAIIRNPLKALRLQEEGLKIGKDKDVQLKDPSYYTGGKTFLQSLGFKDAETTRNMELDIMAGDVEREVAAQKTELLDRRYRAILKYDADPSDKNELELQRVEYDINVYDENYPSNSISKDTKRKSFKAKEQDATDKSYGLGVNPKIPIRDVLYEERIQQALEAEGK